MRAVDDDIAGVERVDTVLQEGDAHPEGRLVRADRVGLGSRLEALDTLTEELGPRFEPPAILERLVAAGTAGVDAGEGFYRWERGEPVEPAVETASLSGNRFGDPAGP